MKDAVFTTESFHQEDFGERLSETAVSVRDLRLLDCEFSYDVDSINKFCRDF